MSKTYHLTLEFESTDLQELQDLIHRHSRLLVDHCLFEIDEEDEDEE